MPTSIDQSSPPVLPLTTVKIRTTRVRVLRAPSEAPGALAASMASEAPDAAIQATPASTSRPRTQSVGRLDTQGTDTMALHTREAWRLFVGRPAEAKRRSGAIPGAVRFAAICRSVWVLSAHDNPYADWFLIRAHEELTGVRQHIEQAVTQREVEFDRLRQRGLNLTVMASVQPMTVELAFGSPYGYAAAEAVMEFDLHVRQVLSLVRRDRLSEEDGHAAIAEPRRRLRRLFLESITWERGLRRDELLPLSRQDFLPSADEAAQARVRAAASQFGEVPLAVLTGQVRPRHTVGRRTAQTDNLRQLKRLLDVGRQADCAVVAAHSLSMSPAELL